MTPEDAARLPGLRSSILRQAQAGREGWDRLVNVCSPAILSTLRRRGFKDDDAADVCQEVLWTMARHLDKLDPTRPFVPWMFCIVNCRCADAHRRREGKPVPVGGTDFQQRMEAQPADAEDFRLDYLREAMRLVREEMPEEWPAFDGVVLKDEPAREVAERLGKSLPWVYRRANKVKARIEEMMQPEDSR